MSCPLSGAAILHTKLEHSETKNPVNFQEGIDDDFYVGILFFQSQPLTQMIVCQMDIPIQQFAGGTFSECVFDSG